MKTLAFLFILFFSQNFQQTELQKIKSGTYGELNIAVEPFTNRIMGFYENHTGMDDETKKPRFSCIFYFEGRINNNVAVINSYHPLSKSEAKSGQLQHIDSETISIKLSEDHGGCGNVQHFSEEPVKFKIDTPEDWIQIRYADKDKAYFYSDYNAITRKSSYILKGDVVYVDKIINKSAHCIYFGDKKISGWIKIEDLNKLD